eukprot:m51a1_g7755 putative family 3 adenylate cyclase (1141) ;mRNA; f:84511-89277
MGDMRVRVVAALVCIVAVAAAAMAASFLRVSATQLRAIEGAQAATEAAMLRGILGSQQAALLSLLLPMAHWDAIYEYLEAQDPTGFMWSFFSQGWAFLETDDLEAVFFVLPNGTMLNGLMWGPNRTSKVRASETLVRQVADQLLRKGSASGLFWIPETSTAVIVSSEYGRRTFVAAADVGWLVYARNVRSLLHPIAETSSVCLAFLTNASECHAIQSIWEGTPFKAGEQFKDDTVNHMVAKASELACAHVTCSSASNQTHDTYLATGVVLSDEVGVPRVYAVIRGIRFDAETIGTYMRYIIAICCSALAAIFLLVYLLVELSVLRILSSLSTQIICAATNARTEDRIKIRGKSEIRNVARAVNELLSALERRTLQTEFIMQNIYPEEVLKRLRSGQSTSQTFQDTSVLFVDICNFTLWSSALDPKVVTRYLNGVYSRMDDTVHKNKATKVMTIGDAYATGSCSSAIIGLRKKFYELWGPSVTRSQQIQEMANPGDILCCGATKDVLEARNKDHYAFDLFVETEGTAMHVWKLSSKGSECSYSDTDSERSLSTTGLLSVMVDDMSICYSPDNEESLRGRVLRSLRLGAVAGMAVLLAASIAAFAVFLLTMLGASSRESIKHRAVADGTRISNVLNEVLVNMRLEGGTYATWSDPVDYMSGGDPNGKFWQNWFADGTIFNKQGLDGIVYFLPNGTLFNSLGFNYATSSLRNISNEEKAVLSAELLKEGTTWDLTTGSVYGLLHDPETRTTRLAVSVPVFIQAGTPIVGWVVVLKDIARLLPAKAEMLDMCIGLLSTDDGGPLHPLWKSSGASTIGNDALSAHALKTDTLVYSQYRNRRCFVVFEGTVFSDLRGERRLLMVTMHDDMLLARERNLFMSLLGIEIALLVFVIAGSIAAMELLIFRGLSRLSEAIATGTSTSKGSVTFSGNNQLQRIAQSINTLIESRNVQHHALQEGTMPNERHDMASILFSDIIGFRDWATVASPDAVSEFLSSFTEGLDAVVEQCCATKIKTILDTYMVASGVPAATPQHAHMILKLALEMHKYSQGKSFNGTEGVSMRIGVSSGPCAGGIIGKHNWIYDLWSDTVNMAARLKAKAAPGTVLCDELTYTLTMEEYEYEEPREVELKGKGVQRVHTLVGARPK